MTANLLSRETSPYLLQHKDNPVHWRPWGAEAFAEARAADKPLLLSVGYAACHWCHVMAHESFEDPETAALMNELFVNVKVDREERPDVDTIYQQALAALGEHGGWPLTMFLTPDGEPFWGGTYFPRESAYGRPGFKDILRRVAEVYRTRPDAVRRNASALLDALARLSAPSAGGPIAMEVVDRIADHLARQVDPVHGGLGPAPKFPQVPALKLLWRAWCRTANVACGKAVRLTLDRMCQGGIYDHLGGGFARYSTDSAWLVPHFEKMLYDNALLVEILLSAWRETRSPLYAARIAETVEWALREMIAPGGGFASSLDADSEGEEGRFYVWTEAEIDALLGTEAPAFKAAYDVRPGGNWEGRTILNRSAAPELGDEAAERRLAACRDILFRERETRVRPGWDDKVLADWNGMMIAAVAEAAAAFERPTWLAAAVDAFRFVVDNMDRDGRLLHSFRDGRARHPGTLDDYANMIRAALALYEVTGEADALARAKAWAEAVEAHFLDAAGGGYFFTADDVDDLITRTRNAHDAATPSGNGLMVENLARLHYLTGEAAYRTRAEATIAAFSGELSSNIFPLATLLNAAEFLERCVQVVVVGPPGDPATRALREAVFRSPEPNRLLRVVAPDADLPPGHPAAGKTTVDGRPAAYVCRGPTCSLPITDPEALADALAPHPAPEPVSGSRAG